MPYLAASSSVTLTAGADSTLTIQNPGGYARVELPVGIKLWEGGQASATIDIPGGSCKLTTITGDAFYQLTTDAPAGTLSASEVASTRALVSGAWSATAAPNANFAPIPVGTFGDSIANISSFANHDLRQISTGSLGSNSDRMGVTLQHVSNGALRVMFNGGVSGDTTTQMLARDAAGSTATRKALTDAMTFGARHLVWSAGVNDLQSPNLTAGASSATIDAAVSASVGRLAQLLRRAVAFGMTPHVVALMGYRYETVNMGSLPTNNLAAVATTQEAIRRWNALAKSTIQAERGAMGYWYDMPAGVLDSNGAWLSGMDQGDGLHPSENSQYLIYTQVSDAIRIMEGMISTPFSAYPPGVNQFANSDFAAATAGVATGASTYNSVGTGAIANSIVTWRGQQWQQCILTPASADGNGNCGLQIDLTYTTPTVGDVLGGEISVYVDDGSGGPPPGVFQWLARSRCGSNFVDAPLFNATIVPKVARGVIDRRCVMNPIVAPATATPAVLSVNVLSNQIAAPFRVMVSRPRVVKLPVAY